MYVFRYNILDINLDIRLKKITHGIKCQRVNLRAAQEGKLSVSESEVSYVQRGV